MPRFSTISDNNSSTIISNFKDIFDRCNSKRLKTLFHLIVKEQNHPLEML